MKNAKSVFASVVFGTFLGITCINALPISKFEKDFLKGNIEDKTNAVVLAAKSGDHSLAVKGLEFSMTLNDSIGNDADVAKLMKVSVENLSIGTLSQEKKQSVSERLGLSFQTFEDVSVKLAILDVFAAYLSKANLDILNSYVADLAQKASESKSTVQMDELTKKTLSVLKKYGDRTTFNVLFTADLMGAWQNNRNILEDAYIPLINASENEILKIFDSSRTSERIKILGIINKNQVITRKIKGKVAETALSDMIINVKGNEGRFSNAEEANLYVNALSMLSDNQWTRSAENAAESFEYAKKAFERKQISQDDFVCIISDISEIACSKTGKVLSSYLDYLNKCMENGNAPVKAVVLSLINALGGLGDKTAFDYLLYVTYLDYPEEVTSAAKVALAQLKW